MIEYDEMDPFGEKYKQKWSATPYSVRCVNDTHQGAVVAYVTLTARSLAMRFFWSVAVTHG